MHSLCSSMGIQFLSIYAKINVWMCICIYINKNGNKTECKEFIKRMIVCEQLRQVNTLQYKQLGKVIFERKREETFKHVNTKVMLSERSNYLSRLGAGINRWKICKLGKGKFPSGNIIGNKWNWTTCLIHALNRWNEIRQNSERVVFCLFSFLWRWWQISWWFQ